MSARDFFEGIVVLRDRVDALRARVDAAYSMAGPHGMPMGTVGGGSHDPLAGVDHIIDSDAMADLETAEGMLRATIDRATDVLYGRSGRGGLARLTSTDDADILLCHYCMGERWADIARQRGRSDVAYPTQWCRDRAHAAMRAIDRVGMDALADS